MDTYYQVLNNWFLIAHDTRPVGDPHYVLHYHHAYEMFIMENGSTNVLLDNRIIHVSKNDIVLIKPDYLHRNTGGTEHTRYAVHFTEKYLLTYFSRQVVDNLTPIFNNNRITIKPSAFLRITELLRRIELPKSPALEYIHIAEIISLLNDAENIEQVQPVYSTDIVNSILYYINKNYGTINGLDDIAREMDISKPYLCQIFKKETAVTVADYLNSVRINNACDILRHSDVNVTETATRCGYNSAMYFCKVFKSIVHMTPREYKRHIQSL